MRTHGNTLGGKRVRRDQADSVASPLPHQPSKKEHASGQASDAGLETLTAKLGNLEDIRPHRISQVKERLLIGKYHTAEAIEQTAEAMLG